MKEIIMAIVVALGILFGGLSVGVLIGREQSKKELELKADKENGLTSKMESNLLFK